MKKMMKKLVSLAMVLGVCFSFTAAMADGQGDWSASFPLINGSTLTHTPNSVSLDGVSASQVDLTPFLEFLGMRISPICNTILSSNESERLFIASLICNAIWDGNIQPVVPVGPTQK